MLTCIIDGNYINDREKLHDALADSLQLPEWYGRNLDALYDCLLDLQEETEIRLLHEEILEQHLGHYAVSLEKVINNACHENSRIHFIENSGSPSTNQEPMNNKEETSMLFVEYPKCTTCQKARKWLDAHNMEYTDRHIVEENPSYDELKEWHEKSGLPLKRFFNTSGLLYKELQLKDKLQSMSEEEQLLLLASNGMLVKRPIVVNGNMVLTGFKEAEWTANLT